MINLTSKNTDPLYNAVGGKRYQDAVEAVIPRLRLLVDKLGGKTPLFTVEEGKVVASNEAAMDISDSIADYCLAFNFNPKDHFAYILLSTIYQGRTLLI